jgi:hypothetical protein
VIVWLGRIKGILFSPVETWKTVKKESGYAVETLVFMFACCLLVGLTSLVRKSGWIAEVFIPFFTVLISSVLVRFLKLIQRADWETTFNQIVYSFFPLSWCYALSFVFGYRQYLLPAGVLYSMVLLFISVKVALNATFFQSLSLTLKIVAILFVCLYFLLTLLS